MVGAKVDTRVGDSVGVKVGTLVGAIEGLKLDTLGMKLGTAESYLSGVVGRRAGRLNG